MLQYISFSGFRNGFLVTLKLADFSPLGAWLFNFVDTVFC